ncbi:CAP domain-containing protein [Marinigracilibium pacificum]|uniref:CAP domain-containing protein n=1 Tax=Marinigracilibium pacificum TaxID=2729599 RepID=A0A848IZC0_9BACT|nr:CAP domain-containing protein [Marinigracilibium pacificum]NMM49627.1 CAP domain-containing protein [Marinigracilibium pacificum]
MTLILTLILSLSTSFFSTEKPVQTTESICITSEEALLLEILNDYRISKKLHSVKLSSKLTLVAKTHARDLMENYSFDETCNPHSWSDKGNWTSCCYTSDHKQSNCMWNKPKEIAEYYAHGYEIIFYHSGKATAEDALKGWKNSTAHNEVVTNTSIWKQIKWESIGVAIDGNWAVVWFGPAPDQSPQPKICQ